jgi:hypothetical protein
VTCAELIPRLTKLRDQLPFRRRIDNRCLSAPRHATSPPGRHQVLALAREQASLAQLDDLGGELDLGRPGDAARLEERGRVDRLADQRLDDRGEGLVTPHYDHDA